MSRRRTAASTAPRRQRITVATGWALGVLGVVVAGGCATAGPTTRAAERAVASTADPEPTVDTSAATVAPGATAAPSMPPTSVPATPVPETSAPADDTAGCAVAESIVRDAAAVRDLPTAGEQLGALGAVIDAARPQLVDVEPATRTLVEQLVAVLDELRVTGDDVRADAAATGDEAVAGLVDRLVVHVHDLTLNPLGLVASVPEAERCPTLERVATAADLAGADPTIVLRELRDDLVARGRAELVEGYLPPGFVEWIDRDMAVAGSGRQEDYDRCWIDLQADVYGDNPGCDALHDACDARDLLACDDLYWSSTAGSGYEAFAATCGDRVDAFDPAGSGSCELLE